MAVFKKDSGMKGEVTPIFLSTVSSELYYRISELENDKKLDETVQQISDEVRRDFGNRLTAFRESIGMTQEKLIGSIPIGIRSVSSLSRLEGGQRTAGNLIELLVALHDVFKVDLNWLVAGDQKSPHDLPCDVRKAILTLANLIK